MKLINKEKDYSKEKENKSIENSLNCTVCLEVLLCLTTSFRNNSSSYESSFLALFSFSSVTH
jgi:hypothetical protein